MVFFRKIPVIGTRISDANGLALRLCEFDQILDSIEPTLYPISEHGNSKLFVSES